MPIVSPIPLNPLIDGRQSERALLVRRGVQRLLTAMGAHVLPELSLATGRRADLVALILAGCWWGRRGAVTGGAGAATQMGRAAEVVAPQDP